MKMTVSISGCVLSALLFKLKNVTADGEGFLLGEVHTHRVENITDSQSSGTREEKRLCVSSYISFNSKYSFYDTRGTLNVGKMEDELGEDINRVIGWFSYRRNSSHRVSLREKALHRRLMNYYEAMNKKDFLFALVTDHLEESTSVLTTDYSFYHWVASCPQHMKVEIVNLRASAAVPYQVLPVVQTSPSLTHYNTVLQEQRAQFMDGDGNMRQAKAVENLYRALIRRFEPLGKELAQSTDEVQQLGEKVAKLRDQVDQLREEQEKLLRPNDKDEVTILVDIEPSTETSPSAQREDLPLLIDWSDIGGDQGQPLPSVDPPASQTLLETNLMETDLMETEDVSGVEGDILQPEVLTDKQSQELF